MCPNRINLAAGLALMILSIVGTASSTRSAPDEKVTCTGVWDYTQYAQKILAACTELLDKTSDPTLRADAYQVRARAYLALGDYAHAVAALDLAITYPGDSSDALQAARLNERAMAYYHSGDYDSAIDDLTRVIRWNVKPLYEPIYRNRGLVYLAKKDFTRANDDLTAYLDIKPEDALTYYYRAVAHIGLGDDDKAIADLSESIRLTSGAEFADFNTRGAAYYRKKMYEEAVADFRAALALRPANETAKANLEAAQKALSAK
jgi:tetratricopeptide (TPR) repeat protein